MTFVALSIPDWPTGAAANDLLAQLLAAAPRAAIAPHDHLAWLDARSLDPAVIAAGACAALEAIGITNVSTGAAGVPIVAAIAANGKGKTEKGKVGKMENGEDVVLPSPFSPRFPFSLFPFPFAQISPGAERSYLAPLPLDVLSLDERLLSLFTGVGLETCGDLARLSRESVEVRFGRDGLAAWRLARADDRRPIFSARPRELPNASLDWNGFSTTDLEQLVFVLHSLLKTVCDALMRDAMGARSLTLTLALENRTTLTQSVGAARSTAQRTTWLRLMRRALERVRLPDRVTGLAIQVDSVGEPMIRQGDLFDLGFASAEAAESAVGHVMDLQTDAVMVMQRSEHPLPERRVKWGAEENAEPGAQSSNSAQSPALHPMLLPSPREITVLTHPRRGFAVPIRYTDNGVAHSLREALGPQCLSGEQWIEPFAREYHQGVRTDGTVVLLYRDVPADTWYLAGWWD
jgi:hypothetical protein